MPADGPVSVTRQCVYAAIPILDIYSAYHIKRLRMYLLLAFLIIVIPQSVVEWVLFGDMLQTPDAYLAVADTESVHFEQSAYVIAWMAAGIMFSVLIIRRWSLKWNNAVSGQGSLRE